MSTILDELGLQPEIKPSERPKRIFLQPGRSTAKTLVADHEAGEVLARCKLDKAGPNGETHATLLVRVERDGTLTVLDEQLTTDTDAILSEFQNLPPIPLDEEFAPTVARRSRSLFRRLFDAEMPKPYKLQSFPFEPVFRPRHKDHIIQKRDRR